MITSNKIALAGVIVGLAGLIYGINKDYSNNIEITELEAKANRYKESLDAMSVINTVSIYSNDLADNSNSSTNTKTEQIGSNKYKPINLSQIGAVNAIIHSRSKVDTNSNNEEQERNKEFVLNNMIAVILPKIRSLDNTEKAAAISIYANAISKNYIKSDDQITPRITDVTVENVSWGDLSLNNLNLHKNRYENCKFIKLAINNCSPLSLKNSKIDNLQISNIKKFDNFLDLDGIKYSNVKLEHISNIPFSSLGIKPILTNNTGVKGSFSFVKCSMKNPKFSSKTQLSSFDSLFMDGCYFEFPNFNKSIINDKLSVSKTNIFKAQFEDASIKELEVNNSSLTFTTFSNTHLKSLTFEGNINIEGSNFLLKGTIPPTTLNKVNKKNTFNLQWSILPESWRHKLEGVKTSCPENSIAFLVNTRGECTFFLGVIKGEYNIIPISGLVKEQQLNANSKALSKIILQAQKYVDNNPEKLKHIGWNYDNKDTTPASFIKSLNTVAKNHWGINQLLPSLAE